MDANNSDPVIVTLAVSWLKAVYTTLGTNLATGFWALGGAAMRGTNDWTDPVTKAFSFGRFATAIMTALTIGELIIGGGSYAGVDPRIYGPLACIFGYLGPAVAVGVFSRLLPGKLKLDDPNAPPPGR